MLEIAAWTRLAWDKLGGEIRAHIERFLTAAPRAPITFVESGAPTTFVRDLGEGAPALRVAFPALVRRVVWIEETGERIAVRIACRARHDGTFFGFALPTGRTVRFAELHELLVERERLVEDRITLDVRAIVRQLVAIPGRGVVGTEIGVPGQSEPRG